VSNIVGVRVPPSAPPRKIGFDIPRDFRSGALTLRSGAGIDVPVLDNLLAAPDANALRLAERVWSAAICPPDHPKMAFSSATVAASMKMWRARAGHYNSTSGSGATGTVFLSSAERFMWIVPSGRSSTTPAPACFAVRIARATSACVKRAGVRLIVDHSGPRHQSYAT
jgi:hypothetical protein